MNGPAFLAGWVAALAVVSGVVYVLADQADAATDSTTDDTIAGGKIVFGALFLLLAVRNWRHRPTPGAEPDLPKWMAGIDALNAHALNAHALNAQTFAPTDCVSGRRSLGRACGGVVDRQVDGRAVALLRASGRAGP